MVPHEDGRTGGIGLDGVRYRAPYSANEKAGEMRPTVALINMQGKSAEGEETT